MSTEIKHTPGPWRINENFGLITSVEYRASGPVWFSVCTMGSIGSQTTTNDQQNANARLIAAAPALLEAAEAAIKYDEAIMACANSPDKIASYCTAEGNDLDDLYDDWISKSKEAIKKAKP